MKFEWLQQHSRNLGRREFERLGKMDDEQVIGKRGELDLRDV